MKYKKMMSLFNYYNTPASVIDALTTMVVREAWFIPI
jgi:hypothetical protein